MEWVEEGQRLDTKVHLAGEYEQTIALIHGRNLGAGTEYVVL